MAAEHAKRGMRPHPQQMVKCPRCESPDTKFCYYNNYSTTQPRYFCKNCKRYWTDGGALRNVPVGGGLRKNKRSKNKILPTAASTSPSPPQQQHLPAILDGHPTSLSSSSHQVSLSNAHIDINRHNVAASHFPINAYNDQSNHGLSTASNLANPGYLLLNPRIYKVGDQANLLNYNEEFDYNNQIVPPAAPSSSMSILGSLKQHISNLHEPMNTSTLGYGTNIPRDQETSLSDSTPLYNGGGGQLVFHHNNDAANYTVNNFVNVNDWQHISEGLFNGGGGGSDSNFFFMQQPPHPSVTQLWSEFDAGTRL